MADYLVTDTELTDVADAIREKGGTSALLEWPDEYVDAIGAISGGGISPWTHLAHAEYDVSTTSTSWKTVGTMSVGHKALNAAQFLYIRVRDKAGVRPGYYAGSDTLIPNMIATSYSGISMRFAPSYYAYQVEGATGWLMGASLYTSANGITPYSFSKKYVNGALDGYDIQFRAKYSSTYGTIDGTYTVDVFSLAFPEGYPTVFSSAIDGDYIVNNIAASNNYASVDKTVAAAGETVTVTAGVSSYISSADILVNSGDGGEFVTLMSAPTTGQTATFAMPDRSVDIIAVMHAEE